MNSRIEPNDPCMNGECSKRNDGSGSGYCSYDCYTTSDTGVTSNPLPSEPSTIDAHIEWLNLRIRTLNQLADTDERDLFLETLSLMERNIHGIRRLLNRPTPDETTAFPTGRPELIFQDEMANVRKVANKSERSGKWPKFSPFI